MNYLSDFQEALVQLLTGLPGQAHCPHREALRHVHGALQHRLPCGRDLRSQGCSDVPIDPLVGGAKWMPLFYPPLNSEMNCNLQQKMWGKKGLDRMCMVDLGLL
jgi:hypothetical protein